MQNVIQAEDDDSIAFETALVLLLRYYIRKLVKGCREYSNMIRRTAAVLEHNNSASFRYTTLTREHTVVYDTALCDRRRVVGGYKGKRTGRISIASGLGLA